MLQFGLFHSGAIHRTLFCAFREASPSFGNRVIMDGLTFFCCLKLWLVPDNKNNPHEHKTKDFCTANVLRCRRTGGGICPNTPSPTDKNDTALVTFGDEKGSNGGKTTIRLNFIVIRISLEMLNRLSFNVSICDIATIF